MWKNECVQLDDEKGGGAAAAMQKNGHGEEAEDAAWASVRR